MSCQSCIAKSAFIVASLAVSTLWAQVPQPLEFVGEVTAESVNVRSGPSANYYVAARLAAGTRVQVVREENEWYAIVPPVGCYSLISKDYVDLGADGNGVVNGNAVRVRCGSDLDPHRYAVQLKLSRGSEVNVLDELPGGFLKIAPPAGALVWIHSEYVSRVPQGMLDLESKQKSSVQTSREPSVGEKSPLVQPASTTPGPGDAAGKTSSANNDSTPSHLPHAPEDDQVNVAAPHKIAESAGDNPAEAAGDGPDDDATNQTLREQQLKAVRDLLAKAETLMEAEYEKPIEDRRFDEALTAFREAAGQELDEYVRKYAARRVVQLEAAVERVEAVRLVRSLSSRVSKDRKDALAARTDMRPSAPAVLLGYDAKGELRESMIYSSPVGPRRYRLVDPHLTVPRTLCYVEIPRDSKIDPKQFLGRTVGVRAREKRLETDGNVTGIQIVVAEEIVVLDELDGDVADSELDVPVDVVGDAP